MNRWHSLAGSPAAAPAGPAGQEVCPVQLSLNRPSVICVPNGEAALACDGVGASGQLGRARFPG